MSRDIPEADWKRFRTLHPIALERYCQRVLEEIQALTADTSKTHHERYGSIYELVKRRDRELARAFDDLRRSTAIIQIGIIASYDLLTDEELAEFSPEIRGAIAFLSSERG
jgi:hypothetical protein